MVDGIVDCFPTPKEDVKLAFEPEWVNNFIGIDVSADEQKKMLEKIGFTVEDGVITAPYFRNDIEHKADISEEIARFYGYQAIPNRELSGVANAALTEEQQLERLIRSTCLGCGLTEIETFSFISPKYYDKINLPADSEFRNSVVIMNPLGEDTSVMRTTAIPSMLEVLARNYKSRNDKAYLYEIPMEYTSQGTETLPLEKQKILIGMYGDCDFFALKGIVEEILAKTGLNNYDVEAVTEDPTFHPGRTARLTVDGEEFAIFGEVHPAVLENYGIGEKAYVARIDIETIFNKGREPKLYKKLPRFPASTRDLAFVCDRDIPVLTLQKAISSAAGKLLETIELFDVYMGSQIEEGKKSVAFSLKLRAEDRTLTDEEADNVVKKAIKALDKLGISLRS